MAKIGIDIRPIGKKRTGDEVYFFNLVKNLAALDKENEYFLYTDRDPEKDADLAEGIKNLSLGRNFQVVFVKNTNRFCWNLWYLPTHLKKNPVDIFHTQYIAPFWLPRNVKLVLTVHDISFNYFPEYIGKSDLFFLKTLIPRGIRRADKIITVSSNERDQIVKFYGVPAEKVEFTHNGVDYDRFAEDFSDEDKKRVREKYKLPEKFLLYVGTMQPRKNIPALIEVVNAYQKKYREDIKLVIVGNRKARNFDTRIDEVMEKYHLQKSIIFPGWIEDEDLPVIYKLAECFVFTSLYEGFGIPIIEAMAAGIPVVSSNKSCMPEVGGSAALFADPQNPEEFSEKIRQALTDENLRHKLLGKGAELAKSYSWQKTAEKTLGIYHSLTKS